LIGWRALTAWVVLTSQLTIFGTASFTLSLDTSGRGKRDLFIAGLTQLWRWLALVNLLSSSLLLLEITAGMAQTGLKDALPLLPEVLKETYAGHIWELRLPASALMLIFAASLRKGAAAISLVMLSASLLLFESLTSHAVDHGSVAVAIHFLHQCSAAVWIGAVLGLWIGAQWEMLSDEWVECIAPWVSRLAGWTVAFLLLSGLLTARRMLPTDITRMWEIPYGRALIVKLGAASVVLMIGAYNRFFLIAHLRGRAARIKLLRNVGVESVLLMLVVGLAAILANTPPAH
jgi:putative copper export protein